MDSRNSKCVQVTELGNPFIKGRKNKLKRKMWKHTKVKHHVRLGTSLTSKLDKSNLSASLIKIIVASPQNVYLQKTNGFIKDLSRKIGIFLKHNYVADYVTQRWYKKVLNETYPPWASEPGSPAIPPSYVWQLQTQIISSIYLAKQIILFNLKSTWVIWYKNIDNDLRKNRDL